MTYIDTGSSDVLHRLREVSPNGVSMVAKCGKRLVGYRADSIPPRHRLCKTCEKTP